MDDMQKLIERYKKELMDMSKSSSQTQTHTEKRRMPQIIGYADDKTEFDRLFDTFAEKNVSREDTKTDLSEEIAEPVWEEKIPDEDEFTADDRQESDMNGLSEEQIPFSADDTAAKDGYPEKFEEEKREKYNPYELFRKREKSLIKSENMDLVVKKDNIIQKIIKKILNIFWNKK